MNSFHRTVLLAALAVPVAAQSLQKFDAISRLLAAEVRRQSPVVSSPDLDAYCQALGRRLLPGSTILCEVIHSESAEPVPIPGGPIFIPTRLLLISRTEAEFAAVLAHALVHSAQPPTGNRLIFPLHDDAQYAIPLGHQAARRETELSTDRQALELVQRAGFPPAALAEYLRRVLPAKDPRPVNLPPATDYFAAPDERFLHIQTLLKSLLPTGGPPTLHRQPSTNL